MIQIPVETEKQPYITLSVNVGEVSLSIRLLWNDRDENWFADFESVNGKNYGVRIVTNIPMLKTANHIFTDGDLVVLKNEMSVDEPLGFENFGTTYCLYYMTNDEIEIFHKKGIL